MASPQQDSDQHGKKKSKTAKKDQESAGDGQPGPSTSAQKQAVPKDKGGVKGDKSHPKEQQQKKEEKQSKPPKPKPESGKPPAGGDGGGGGGATGVAGGEGDKPKSKAQLKAERRAIQEKQRALKEAKKAGVDVSAASSGAGGATGSGAGSGAAAAGGKREAGPNAKKDNKTGDGSKAAGPQATSKSSKSKKANKVDYHSLTEEQRWAMKEKEMLSRGCKMDDSIFNLGLQFFHQKIVGADARCVALLSTLKEVIGKYKTPEEKELSRDLEKNYLAPCIKYINDCRPLSTSMGNGIKHLKQQINQIPQGTEDDKAIEILQDAIDNFIYENITRAAEAVAHYANKKIDDGDVILIYAASSLIGQVLKFAHEKGKQFHVIVVEGRPRTEGKTMLKYLVRCGISCSYIYIGSASHAMRETTKVFLGAAAMFAIGDMHSRTGNAMIAALAKANNIPVLVCCETYKFTDKVHLSSALSNQSARGKDLISIGHRECLLSDYQDIDLHLMNTMYDVTPSGYITALVTELGMLPCTSVPVVLRRQEDKCL